ncbi:aldehyde dehydrogenase [Actinacidiphila oryziradicis]|uniref:Aldehyde dehydrogenase n=1 Tax=Actinacidiphila oryziradicis TaxID=2571141 RepID=A0A4U0T0W8_9ACTN|nr:aldehyde dehydrogenase [Actinacidiphila oryziradicis]TKA06405.1 aldehyde dehydrogenase [Actinacidiphila oryziradicis]
MNPHHESLFIGGRWVAPASDEKITVLGSSTEDVLGSVPAGNEKDIDVAVAAARAAFDDPDGWAAWQPARRANALCRLADALERRMEAITHAVSAQNGMTITLSEQVEGALPTTLLRYYADLIRDNPGEDVRDGMLGAPVHVRREPLGVVAAIVPWNAPQLLSATKYAPGLAAGCTFVLKPSPETVLDAVLFAEAVEEADLPPGVINIVPAGREVGAYLVSHPDVDKVAFTGSTAAGRQIAATCGSLLRPVTLELGGKSAAVILDDVDLNTAIAEPFFLATLLANGQACFASTRVLAPRSRYDEVVDAVASLVSGLTVGDPLDTRTQIGPMASARQRDRVEGYIEKGKTEGARLVVGGSRPTDLAKGFYVTPTVFADVDNSQTIAREEIFGPVLSVIAYTDEDDAVRIANDSEYGLGGSVWTDDDERGMRVARRIHTGTIGLNHYTVDPAAPFGGVKASGLGREFGPEALHNYQQIKSIYR